MRKCYLCRASMHLLFKFINLAFDVAFGIPNFFLFFFFNWRGLMRGRKKTVPFVKVTKIVCYSREFDLKKVSCMVHKKVAF